MNKKILILSCAAVLVVAGAFTFGNIQSQASATTEQEAQQVATDYLDALVAKDVEKVVKYVQDVRFKTDAEELAGYQDIVTNNPVYSYKILSVETKSPTQASVTIEYTSEHRGTDQTTFNVFKKGKEWQVTLENIELKKSIKNK
ncbi:hypothetical protein CBW65_03965 [Tumebacillus avium]|uniref:DUF4878 domain-containing protein n=1 Tax=Tumebacillus avium TaxID=1903704 RepID=A0A1Y0III5_9BACL|nr:hypothetical protein [Tumebacillus avium]ARU60312.1 hypothetical protein CBW65_03965 [Tumebacillus avium]